MDSKASLHLLTDLKITPVKFIVLLPEEEKTGENENQRSASKTNSIRGTIFRVKRFNENQVQKQRIPLSEPDKKEPDDQCVHVREYLVYTIL